MSDTLAFCLCADDYALSPGVTRGILAALEAGALTATSVMTTSPWWPESVPALKTFEGQADIGLHLNLTLGAPLGPMPRFAPHGFPPLRDILLATRTGRPLPEQEIAEEIERQLDRFAELFGRPPDHVDGHQHVQALPAVRRLLLHALGRRGWRPWLRDSSDRLWRILARPNRKKALIVSYLASGFHKACENQGLATNNGFAGFSSFDCAEDYSTLFASYLRRAGPCHLVMCHPGYVDDELRRLDPVLESREQELRFLLAGLGETLERHGARLVRLSTLLASALSDQMVSSGR
jgi:predicted glycoside hydrolase/deacetylase ChbG (UPF0249 family)